MIQSRLRYLTSQEPYHPAHDYQYSTVPYFTGAVPSSTRLSILYGTLLHRSLTIQHTTINILRYLTSQEPYHPAHDYQYSTVPYFTGAVPSSTRLSTLYGTLLHRSRTIQHTTINTLRYLTSQEPYHPAHDYQHSTVPYFTGAVPSSTRLSILYGTLLHRSRTIQHTTINTLRYLTSQEPYHPAHDYQHSTVPYFTGAVPSSTRLSILYGTLLHRSRTIQHTTINTLRYLTSQEPYHPAHNYQHSTVPSQEPYHPAHDYQHSTVPYFTGVVPSSTQLSTLYGTFTGVVPSSTRLSTL